MTGLLAGKALIIVGAGNGLGRAEALACAAEGAHLLVNDLGCDAQGRGEDAKVAETLARQIRESGGVAHASSLDAALPGNAEKLVQQAKEHFGRLDGVLYSAGIALYGSLEQLREVELERLWQVQVRGAVALTRQAAKAMAEENHGGVILLTASPMGLFGAVRQSGWSLTSGALIGFARAAAAELRRQRIRVNVLAPTARTRSTEDLPLFRGIRGDSLSPAHVAPLAVFLFSDAAAAINGEVIGAAGARLYSLSSRESPGVFAPAGQWQAQEIGVAWPRIV